MIIEKIAIIGSGMMGSSIAQFIANLGFEVTIWSRRGEDGLSKLREGVQKAVDKKILTENQAAVLLSRITCTSSLSNAVETADLIIEAVIEDLGVKKNIFDAISTSCQSHAIITSNTSSLSISDISANLDQSYNIVGMHFFNPVYAMKLVEVVKIEQTSEETFESIVEFCKRIGKCPIVVNDTPGFVVNRILMPTINSAAFVLMEGVATPETIDLAMQLGANYPMGPLALADLIGLDTCLKIMTEFCSRLEHADYQICPLLEKMVAEGNLGRKTGRGFFNYESNGSPQRQKTL
jgi:3-hydroxybutyryl-CoA dehydrogenase